MYGKGLLKGLGITLDYHLKKKITKQYPEQKPELAPRFRGCLEYDMGKCIACNACIKACPNAVLELTTAKGADGKRKPASFVIDLQYCMFCAFCVEACSTGSLYFSPNFELACFNREQSKRSYEAPVIIENAPAAEIAMPAVSELAVALANKQDLVKKLAARIGALKKELQEETLIGEERLQKEERLAKLSTVLSMTKRDLKQLKTESEAQNSDEPTLSEKANQDKLPTTEIIKTLRAQIDTLKKELQNELLTEGEKLAKNEQLSQLNEALDQASAKLKTLKIG